MLEVKGYSVNELIYSGRLFNIYRAVRMTDQQKVIFKICRSDQPSLHDLATLQHEYQILRQLHSPYIIKAYDLIKYQHKSILIIEDIDGQSLKDYLSSRPLGLKDFFTLALQITTALKVIHQQNIIHKDINPQNILIHPDSLSIKVEDFGISSQLTSQESQELIQVQNLEGTLAYMSPEQTGRMNRSIDYRSDFYSLGVTFYEMLAGRLPFPGQDQLELVYDHLAKVPVSLHLLNFEIPEMIGAIVAKLLAKIPEERYTSAAGLEADLLECQRQWTQKQSIDSFPLGHQDVYDHLIICQKLYGREEQTAHVLTSFEAVSRGNKELLFVSGYSGIGKTSLVKEVYRPITRQRGYFVSGKYDQLKCTTPYSAFIEVFQELMRRFLAEPQDQLEVIKKSLIEALGANGQIIVNVIPSVALIIGPQPPVSDLPPTESQNRFMLTFQNFIRTLARPEHPLVIFLDDLQWVDSASLQLLKLILSDPEVGHLFIIGAYRDNEVTPDHLLTLLQQELEKTDLKVSTLSLSPLQQTDIENLLADSLNCSRERVTPLASLLLGKTHGNPYFINEILKKLYEDRILVFSHTQRQWQWDMNQIQQENITDNVVDLLLERILQLSDATQTTLKLAACIGHSFDLNTLSVMRRQSLNETAGDLLEAIQSNLIRATGEQARLVERLKSDIHIDPSEEIIYRFTHDRIQQSAHQLIEVSERPKIHLNMGRLSIQSQPLDENDERLFEILNHFNQGLALIEEEEEKLKIAQGNLWAGKKAKTATAYQIAKDYLKAGISLLPKSPWKNQYDLAYSLHKEWAECEYLTTSFEEANQVLQLLLEHTQTTLDKVAIYKMQMAILQVSDHQPEALELAIKAISLLGVKLPKHTSKLNILINVLKIKYNIGFKKIADLNLPPVTDLHKKEIYDLSQKIGTLAYFLDQNLFAYIESNMILFNLNQGSTEGSSRAYVIYGFILIHVFNWYQEGLDFIDLAEKVNATTVKSPYFRGRDYFTLGVFILQWKYPFERCLEYLNLGYQNSLEAGDLIYADYTKELYICSLYVMGKPLSIVTEAIQACFSFRERFKINAGKGVPPFLEMSTSCLQDKLSFNLPAFLESAQGISHRKNKTEIAVLYVIHARFFYIMGLFKEALTMGEENEEYISHILASSPYAEGKFYYALSMTALYDQASKKEQALSLKKLKAIYQQFKRWVSWCPENWKQYERLLAAEIARLMKESEKAKDLYDEAILAATESDGVHLIGIANECAARFYLHLKKPHIARIYFQKAHYAYSRWGAFAKTKLLEQNYSDFFEASQTDNVIRSKSSVPTGTTPLVSIDMLSLFKSTQAISSEIRLDRLLEKLLVLLLQNAGAQRGMLLMIEGDKWFVKAEGTAEKQNIILSQEGDINCRIDAPLSLISYALRTQEKVLIQSAQDLEPYLAEDPYLARIRPHSTLILPLPYQGHLHCLLFLENQTTSHAFTPAHIQTLELLASQAASSLENARLYYQATHDPLTGLANRNLLYQMFNHALNKAKRDNSSIAILFLDLDKFKAINDTLGHEVGDKVLLHFAEQIKLCLREQDLAVRLGGDEFIIMLEDITAISQITVIADRILQLVSKSAVILGHEILLGTSIGISLYPKDGADIQDLLKQADEALYKVKQAGKGHYSFA